MSYYSLLERFDVTDSQSPICIDVETVSFDDKVKALRPFHGHKITMIQIGQYGRESISLPIRTRHTESKDLLQPIELVVQEVNEFADHCRGEVLGHNLKFDLRFLKKQGIEFKYCLFRDTMLLARLINNQSMSYSLDSLCKEYGVTQKKSDLIAEILKFHKSQDYGIIPIKILSEYGEGDITSTCELYKALLARLPAHTKDTFDIESKLIRIMFDAEYSGVPLDKDMLAKRRMELVCGMIKDLNKIHEIAGFALNPSSATDIGAYFNSIGIESQVMTKPSKKNKDTHIPKPSWDADALELIAHPLARLLVSYREKQTQDVMFCEKWLEECDEDGVLHTTFNISGTRSGRFSSSEPNLQNPPEWAMSSWIIPEGYVGIKWDLAQIEYRIFAHYANHQPMIDEYVKNPRIDFHQWLADLLMLPRKPIKSVNFGIVYGMGKKKLVATLIALLSEFDDVKIKESLIGNFFDPLATITEWSDDGGKTIRNSIMITIAENILTAYHEAVPGVKILGKKIKDAIYARGKVRNYFGREYAFTMDKCYIGMNYLIQGSSADLFKRSLVHLAENINKYPSYRLYDNIHDAAVGICLPEHVKAYWQEVNIFFDSQKFRVPIMAEFEYYRGRFGKIKPDEFNSKYPVGTKVMYQTCHPSATTCAAYINEKGKYVITIDTMKQEEVALTDFYVI